MAKLLNEKTFPVRVKNDYWWKNFHGSIRLGSY